MADQIIHDLDKDIQESFKFIVRGHTYQFRQMTTEEIDAFQNTKGESEIRKYLLQFITSIDENSPSFEEVSKQMIAPQWNKFAEMIRVEMTGNGSN